MDAVTEANRQAWEAAWRMERFVSKIRGMLTAAHA
jgi:hypothetical protein